MDTIGNYWFFWLLYLAAATVFLLMFWRLTRFRKALWTAYSLRAVAMALVLTPWYSNPQESGMAPALMVAALDGITVGGSAAYRSFVPLVLAILFGLVAAGILSYIFKKKSKLSLSNKEISSSPKPK